MGGEGVGVCFRPYFAPFNAAPDDVLDGLVPAEHGLLGAGQEGGVGVVGDNGRVQHRTAAGNGLVVGNPFKDTREGQEAVNGVAVALERGRKGGVGLGYGIVEGLQGQVVFVGKVVVDAALFQPGGGHDVGQRRAEVALAVEEDGRFGEDHFFCLFAFCFYHVIYRFRPNGLKR